MNGAVPVVASLMLAVPVQDNITTLARQLFELLSPVPFAVTVMLSIVPTIAPGEIVTLNVALSLAKAGTTSEVGNTLGDQLGLALSVAVNE